jgi:type I restriction enzyme S subunit
MAGETINAAQLLKTSERIAKSYKRSAVFSGDIIFALRATVGKVLPVSKELEGSNLTQGTAKISPKKSIESTFLLWALRTAVVQDQIRLHQKGTTFMEITLADLRSIEVALPIMWDEQSSISEKLTTHDDLRLQYIQNRQKLHSLKTALMQDLLTGKKRVNALLNDTEVIIL